MQYPKKDFQYDIVRYIFPTDAKLKACPLEEIEMVVNAMTQMVYKLGTSQSLQEILQDSPKVTELMQTLRKAVQNDNYNLWELTKEWAYKASVPRIIV